MDREHNSILEVGDSLDFIDMSFLSALSNHPTVPAPSDTFIPQLDSRSAYAFGTNKMPRPSTESAPTRTSTLGNDSGTVILSITTDSRISILESCVSNVETLLKQLVCQGNIGILVTPSDTSQSV